MTARREAAAMKKNILAAVVGGDKTEAFLPHDLLYGSRHILSLPSNLGLPLLFLDIFTLATYFEFPISYN